MALDFPNSPTVGQIFSGPKGTFSWDGVKWVPVTAGGFGDAPSDGNTYGRKNAAWSAIAASAGLVAFNVYSSSQTITIPAGATKAVVELWGGAGGTGNASTGANQVTGCGGGGAGGFLIKSLTGLTAGNTLVYTQGAAGAGGPIVPYAPHDGGPGGASTLASGTQTISTLTANGGSGSLNAWNGGNTPGGAGGTATGGDLNFTGSAGTAGITDTTDTLNYQGWGGAGGLNMYSRGGQGLTQAASASPTVGNPGTSGGMIIWWFS
jgi:hypothetical protein